MSLCLIAHQKALGQKTVGRYPYALVPVQSFSDGAWVMPKKKSRCSLPGPPSLMTYPSPNRSTKYLCVRLTRLACIGWHVSAWFDRATTGVPRDGPNHSGAAETTSSGHLTDGFAWGRPAARLSYVQGPGKGLLHTDIQGKQLRGDLPEELPFSLNRGQRMDQLPLLVFVGEDLKPFW